MIALVALVTDDEHGTRPVLRRAQQLDVDACEVENGPRAAARDPFVGAVPRYPGRRFQVVVVEPLED